MAVIVVAVIGMAALRNAGEIWAGMIVLTALTAVGIALIGAVISRDTDRVWWGGFAFFAATYLIVAFSPWVSHSWPSFLWTTQLLIGLHKTSTSTHVQFQRVGQSLFALLAGLLGGSAAVWFHGRRERQEHA
jgi:hypothetical protein